MSLYRIDSLIIGMQRKVKILKYSGRNSLLMETKHLQPSENVLPFRQPSILRLWGLRICPFDLLICAIFHPAESRISIDLACPELWHAPVFASPLRDVTSVTTIRRVCPASS
jgi:hypothetical protein